MLSPAIEQLVRSKIAQFNVMMGSQPQPGQTPGMAGGGMTKPGIVPGPITLGGGDNTMTPMKSGEYVIPVEAVMGIGKRYGAASHGDALAIGKHVLDKEVMGLKKEMGNNNPPRNADVGTDQATPQLGQGVGFDQGGMFAPIMDWTNKNIIGPAKGLIMGIAPHPTTPAPAPLQPNQMGTGLLNRAATPSQTHNQAIENVANQIGYDDGGMIASHDIPRFQPEKGIPQTQPIDQAGRVLSMDQSGRRLPMPERPGIPVPTTTVTSPSPSRATGKGISTPGITPEPATTGIPSGHATMGGKTVNYGDIGIAGQDPFAGKTPVEHARQFAPQYHGMADETPKKVEPQILVGNPRGISSYMNEKEAYAKGLMSPKQKAGYEQRQMAEKELTAKTDLAKATMGIKKEEADTHKKAAEDKADYQKQLVALKGKVGSGIVSGLDDQTKHDLALQYLQTKQMPPLGMGSAAAADRQAILNEYSKIMHSSGTTPEEVTARQSAFKASQTELNKLQGQRGIVMAFAETADKNLGLVEKLSDTVGRTGVPILNKWVLAGKRSVAGDPETAKFDAAIRTAINEFAKVTSSATGGQVTSDSARKEVESMLNTAQTPEQVKQVISTLRQEMGNRKAGYDDQINMVKSAISGKPQEPAVIPAGQGGRIEQATHRAMSDMRNHDWNSPEGRAQWKKIHDNLLQNGYGKDEIEQVFNTLHGGG